MTEGSWRVEWRGPNAEGEMVFRSETYTDNLRARVAAVELMGKPLVTQVSYVDLAKDSCTCGCGLIYPNCEYEND